MSENFAATVDAKARKWAEIAARKAMLRDLSNRAASVAYSEWFRARAREFGGVNPTNRAQIEAESADQAKQARRRVYLSHGYTVCGADNRAFSPEAEAAHAKLVAKFNRSKSNPTKLAITKQIDELYAAPASWVVVGTCDNLVTPGFDLCPDHAPISA